MYLGDEDDVKRQPADGEDDNDDDDEACDAASSTRRLGHGRHSATTRLAPAAASDVTVVQAPDEEPIEQADQRQWNHVAESEEHPVEHLQRKSRSKFRWSVNSCDAA